MNEQKLKINVAATQHAVDWGTGMVSREQRAHSFRLGDANGFQRAIDYLESQEFNERCENGVNPAEFLKEKQKELTDTIGPVL